MAPTIAPDYQATLEAQFTDEDRRMLALDAALTLGEKTGDFSEFEKLVAQDEQPWEKELRMRLGGKPIRVVVEKTKNTQ